MTRTSAGSQIRPSARPEERAVHPAGTGAGVYRTARPSGLESASSSWSLPVRLVGRDDDVSQALLLWLLRYPLLRAEDLAAITGYSRQRIYVQLAQLEVDGTVEAVRVPALGRPSARLYHVSAVGMEHLAEMYGDPVWRAAHLWGADESGLQRLLPRAPALVAVQTVVLSLIGGIGSAPAPSARAERLAPQQVDAGLVPTEWAWERDYPFALTGQKGQRDANMQPRSRSVRLDAYVTLRVRPSAAMTSQFAAVSVPGRTEYTTSYGAFVLHDDALLDPGRPRAMLRALLRGRQALEAEGGTMPPLLLLVPDVHCAQRWQALNARTAMERWLARPLDGGILVVPPPWQNGDRALHQAHSAKERSSSRAEARSLWHANWLSLSDSGSQRLAAILMPAPEPSLPALSMVAPTYDLDTPRAGRRAKVIGRFNDRADRWAEWVPWRVGLGGSPTAGRGARGTGPAPRSGREHLALLTLRLDARHSAVLALLAAHPLLSGEELAAVLGIRSASVDVYLRHLHRLGLVVRATNLTLGDAPPAPPDPRWPCGRYALTAVGAHLLSARSSRTTKGAPSADGRGLPGRDGAAGAYSSEVAALIRVLAHTAGVYQFVASLYRAASAARAGGQAHRMVWWETGRACTRQYREVDGWHALRPDAAGEYQAGMQRLRFWLEWDRGTMRRRDLEAKFAAYAHYVRSREWRSDGNTPLPHLLVVTNDFGQETRVMQALQLTGAGATPLGITITQAALLDKHGPLAPIWRPLVTDSSARRIMIGAPCALCSDTVP